MSYVHRPDKGSRNLPPKFTSLYRLFLRAISASTLHNGPATRRIRRLYKPNFEAAARNIRHLENMEAGTAESVQIQKWLDTFDQRSKKIVSSAMKTSDLIYVFALTVNNTLEMLHTSSYSRGLAHQLFRSLAFLSRFQYSWSYERYLRPASYWNPKLPPNSPEYKPQDLMEGSRKSNKEKNRMQMQKIKDKTWNAFGEVINMAEGRDGVIMGRVKWSRKGAKL